MLKNTNKKEPNGSLDTSSFVAFEGCGQLCIIKLIIQYGYCFCIFKAPVF